MSKKGDSVLVGMRLPVAVVQILDELAESTSGSRGDVVQALVRQAEVREVTATVKRLTLADEPREAAVDE